MASKKFKTYCRIIDYVESVDPELASILHGTCADISLGSMKGKPGITFLMPQDKAFRSKLAELAYSDDIKDANKACDMLNAIIIRDVLKTPSDWLNKRDDIPNSLLPPQHVEVENVTGKEVIFASSATNSKDKPRAELDERFKDASRRSNLAVWKLYGEIPVTTDKDAKLKYAKRGKQHKSKTGGYEVTSAIADNIRFKISIAVENIYMYDRLQKDMDPNTPCKDAFLEHSLSLVCYILDNNYMDLFYQCVLPLITYQKVDFYYLLEPHRVCPDDNYLIPTSIIRDWWLKKHPVNVRAIMDRIDAAFKNATSHCKAKIYTDSMCVINAIAKVRMDLSAKTSQPRSWPDEICKIYEKLEKTNTIGGEGPIFPDQISELYAREPNLKITQDELRYLTYLMFCSLERPVPFDVGLFQNIINMIAERMHSMTGPERERNLTLLNKSTIKYLIAPTEKVNEISSFVNSTCFLKVPLTQDSVMNLPIKNSLEREILNNMKGIWNIDKRILSQHQRLANFTTNMGVKDLIMSMRNQDVSTMDESTKNAILEIYAMISKRPS